jgi:L-lactate dehydrogenase (cytochrome)
MDLDLSHPAIGDLARTARRRIPHFAWEYLDSATGTEQARARTEAALDAVRLMPHALSAVTEPDLSTRLLGRDYPLPFGVAPVGMSGLIWPGAERHLARLAAAQGIPYCLSTVAAATPEEVGPHAGGQGWFQLYPPADPAIRDDMLARAREAGFHTLVLTVDVPVASRRERQRRARLSTPMRLGPRVVLDAARRPAWAIGQLQRGIPRLKTLEHYVDVGTARNSTEHSGYLIRCAPDVSYLRALRAAWDGALAVKGILNANDARSAVDEGADAIWVSNHGGRQFDGGPSPIRQLPQIRAALGPEVPLIYDSGVRSGLDILRALARGADFVMVGRAFHYGLAAFGPDGAAHALRILRDGMRADMCQLGCARLAELPSHLVVTEA